MSMRLRHAGDLLPHPRAKLLAAHAYECYLTDRMETGSPSCSAARSLWAGIGDRVRSPLPFVALADGLVRRADDEAQRYATLR